MFAIYLINPGQNRLRVISLAQQLLSLDRADAKRLIDSPRPRLATGSPERIAYLRRQFQEAAATVEIEYAPDAMELESWPPDNLSIDKKTCRKCGASLFFAVPGRTTQQEIAAFARTCRAPSANEIARDKWIHPGVYCPNGCGFAMVNLGHPDIMCAGLICADD